MALPVALAVVLVLTIVVASVLDFSASGSRDSSRSLAEQDALAVAEDGLGSAAAVLAAAPTQPGPISGTKSVSGGTVSWTGTWDAGAEVWNVTSTASVGNPTGPGTAPVVRTVEAQFELAEDNGAWNFVWLRSAPGECINIKNSFGFSAPLYVVGCLVLENSAVYNGPHIYVTDYLWTTHPSAGVGSAANPVPHVSVRDRGCRYRGDATYYMPCTSAQNVWYEPGGFDRNVPTIPKPPQYFVASYDAADPGIARHTCISPDINQFSSKFTATKMDDNTSMDKSAGTINLMPAVSYDCTQRAADGSVLGRIQWTGITIVGGIKQGTLTITGTIVLDGDLVTENDVHGVVNGSGVIYVTNTLTMKSNSWVCGTVDCGLSWDPNAEPPHLLFIYAGTHDPAADSIIIQSDAKFQGGLYAVGGLKVENNGFVHGPAVADQTEAQNGADFNPWPWFVELPDGVESGIAPTLRLKPGSWRG